MYSSSSNQGRILEKFQSFKLVNELYITFWGLLNKQYLHIIVFIQFLSFLAIYTTTLIAKLIKISSIDD